MASCLGKGTEKHVLSKVHYHGGAEPVFPSPPLFFPVLSHLDWSTRIPKQNDTNSGGQGFAAGPFLEISRPFRNHI